MHSLFDLFDGRPSTSVTSQPPPSSTVRILRPPAWVHTCSRQPTVQSFDSATQWVVYTYDSASGRCARGHRERGAHVAWCCRRSQNWKNDRSIKLINYNDDDDDRSTVDSPTDGSESSSSSSPQRCLAPGTVERGLAAERTPGPGGRTTERQSVFAKHQHTKMGRACASAAAAASAASGGRHRFPTDARRLCAHPTGRRSAAETGVDDGEEQEKEEEGNSRTGPAFVIEFDHSHPRPTRVETVSR